MDDKELLFSTNNSDNDLLEILSIQDRIKKEKPDKLGLVKPIIVTALEICLKAHRRNGCNHNQLKEMNRLLSSSQEFLK